LPLYLELAGFYDPPFHLRSEASVRVEFADKTEQIFQGRIDGFVLQDYLWIVLEDFSLNRRQNELYNVLQILNRIKLLPAQKS
jgi:hypothetical protein